MVKSKKSAPAKKSEETPVEDSTEAKEEVEDSPQENGEVEVSPKKKAAPKAKAAKKAKTSAPPERKSSRAPKPVVKEGTENDSYEKFKGDKKGKKRSASKSPAKSPKKAKAKEPKDFEVDEIVGVRVKGGKKEFKIRWKGYKESDDSWEPEKHLSCQDLIDAYLEAHKDEEVETIEAKKTPSKKAKSKGKKGAKAK